MPSWEPRIVRTIIRVSIVAKIRAATPAECAALGALHRRSSYVWEEDRPHFEAHPDVFGVDPGAIAEGRVRVAVDVSGKLLGFATVADGGPGVCEVEDLFVEPEVMRHGVGRALVHDAVARARAAGSELMTVVAHPRTFGFYESAGFVPGEQTQTRFGPAVRLRRRLTGATRQAGVPTRG
jgi:GNAT superfamily N-acetyltransferase